MIADVWSLFVLAWGSLNCLVFLNDILCVLVCFLNMYLVLSLEMHFGANLVVSISLLCLSVGNFNCLSPSLYEYCPFVIFFTAVFVLFQGPWCFFV